MEDVMRRFTIPVCLTAALCSSELPAQSQSKGLPGLADLRKMEARFAPTDLKVDVSALSAGDHKALAKLIEAAHVIDDLYMEQVWSGNRARYAELKRSASSPLDRARLSYYWLNKSPWADLDDFAAFIPGVPARKPLGGNFYPADMTKAEFEAWANALDARAKQEATGFYSVIRRAGDGAKSRALTIVPFSKAYTPELTKAAGLLREAAALTDNPSLKRFLTTRADAFLSDDYYASDVAWMDLDAPLDVTIGPYETYTDELFGYKAAFEAYINLRDAKETRKLGVFAEHLQEIENNLPEDPAYRVKQLGALSPIRVVNEVIASGDGAHGVATAAYNLPNDDRVVAEKGSKRIMLKNVQEAKFAKILTPISKRVLSPAAQKEVSFDWFFTHILAHELTHGLGPHQITLDGRQTNPRLELKEQYAAIEESKADVTGLFALQYLIDNADRLKLGQVLDVKDKAAAERKLYTTYLASAFRTLRFGTGDSHGKGMVVQMNFLMDRGAIHANSDGTFAIDFSKIKQAVRDLDTMLLTLEAKGDYAGAKRLLDNPRLRPEVERAIEKLKDLPVDIAPRYVTADMLTPRK
jgi:hypothetical protein